ncbi:MAG: zinc ribbon domain-containing protein [Desulfosarcinaceae bacterium]|nr:zinc ribbon domain-containing protein [Desulfosarcinaceae bacterium]
MPIYEYQCSVCGRIEEALQKISDAPLTTCPHCSGDLNKLISQSAFHLKGSGWYVTDYADKGKATPSPTSEQGSKNTSPPSEKPKSTKAKSDGAKDNGGD